MQNRADELVTVLSQHQRVDPNQVLSLAVLTLIGSRTNMKKEAVERCRELALLVIAAWGTGGHVQADPPRLNIS